LQKLRLPIFKCVFQIFLPYISYIKSWSRPIAGLKHNYLYGLAVDSANPQTVIISASLGPWAAHSIKNAETFLYRKSEDSKNWKVISDGLPEATGTIITILASNPKVAGEFYAVNNHGLFLSTDSGSSWKKIDTLWSREYLQQTPWAIAINER
jgi:hypothetical protein